MAYGHSKQASKQANIHTHVRNAVPLVWGSLRLAPIMARGIQQQGPFYYCTLTCSALMDLSGFVVNTQAINHNMLIAYFDSLPLLCLTILKKLSNTNTAYAVCKFIAFPRRLSFNFVLHTGVKLCLTTLCIAFTPKRGI